MRAKQSEEDRACPIIEVIVYISTVNCGTVHMEEIIGKQVLYKNLFWNETIFDRVLQHLVKVGKCYFSSPKSCQVWSPIFTGLDQKFCFMSVINDQSFTNLAVYTSCLLHNQLYSLLYDFQYVSAIQGALSSAGVLIYQKRQKLRFWGDVLGRQGMRELPSGELSLIS